MAYDFIELRKKTWQEKDLEKQVKKLTKKVKKMKEQLRLGDVSNRRKLLIDLIIYAQTSMLKSDKIRTPDEVLNDFQSNL